MASLPMVASGGGGQVVVDSFTPNSSTRTTINIGFEPQQLTIWGVKRSGNGKIINMYDVNYESGYFLHAEDDSALTRTALNGSSNYRLYEVTSTGFTINAVPASSGITTIYYYAIGV